MVAILLLPRGNGYMLHLIGFNPKFILDALRVIDDEEIIEKMCRTDMVKYIDYQK